MTDETTPETAELAAPVETTEPVESAPTPETTAPDDAGQPAPEDKVPESVQKRIDRAVWKQREAERRLDEVIRHYAAPSTPEPETTPQAAEPRMEDFAEDYDGTKYRAALKEWVRAETKREVQQTFQQERERQSAETATQTFQRRVADFAKSATDFQEVAMDPTLPVSGPMARVISASEVGPAVLYHLGQNREIAESIARLPADLAAYELGKIEARISQPKAPTPKAPPVSQAPPPAPKIEASDPQVDVDPDQMSTEEWIKWREKQVRAANARKFIKR